MTRLLVLLPLVIGVAASLPAQDAKQTADDGFRPLFNGKDLTGWVNVNCHPSTFFVKDGEIVTTGKPTGFLRTDRQYENFVLEMDWMHVNKTEVGNSGLFVWGDPLPAVGTPYTRGIEVQVLVNLEYKNKDGKVTATSHGDLFSIHGAKCVPDRPHPNGSERCLPSEYRAKGGGEWNHYKVTANDGAIKLEVNGKEVSGVSKCNPRKGYLALESEGAECHFKNIKIKELPSTNPKPEEVAKVDQGFKSIFNGIDLAGWSVIPGKFQDKPMSGWKVADGKLVAGGDVKLTSNKKYDKFELLFDWRVPANSKSRCWVQWGQPSVNFEPHEFGGYGLVGDGWDFPGTVTRELKTPTKPGGWTRCTVAFDGKALVATQNGQEVARVGSKVARPAELIRFWPEPGLEVMNVFVRELKEEKK